MTTRDFRNNPGKRTKMIVTMEGIEALRIYLQTEPVEWNLLLYE